MPKEPPRPSPETPLPAAIYCRISRDREGAGLGVERQEADCRALATRLGWDVAAVFVDNDISAYSGARRPQYDLMLQGVREGDVKAIVAWHPDRLHRRALELEEFVSLAESHHLAIQTVTAGSVDLTTASGRMVARMLGAAAQHEVDHARERMRRAKRQMAADGKYRGGMRPYGFEKDGVAIRESEAAVVRQATSAVLAGRSLAAIARELNQAGHKTSTGNAWTYSRLRDVLTRPRNAGLLSLGRADRNEHEIVGKADWPGILDEETWRAMYALLSDPTRRKQDGNATRWLGSGIYTCGLCGTAMRAAPYGGTEKRSHERRHLYRCTATAHLTISTDRTDEFVRGVVAELLRDPRVVEAMHPQDDALRADRERRTALTVRLEGFEADYAHGTITGAQLQKASATVAAELAEIDARLTSGLQRSSASRVMRAPDPGEAFLAAPIDVQRAVLRSVLTVEVRPTPRRGAAWSSERLHLSRVGAEA